MSIDTSMSEEQTALTMKKQLLGELWNEIRRAVEILNSERSENESIKQNLAKANAEIEKLKSQILDLQKMVTARESSSSSAFEEKEKNRLIEVARELISKIDTQLSLF
jgi:predicted  nucleic acid-binding Zn-ribbon protein